jgi:hypothetical protein
MNSRYVCAVVLSLILIDSVVRATCQVDMKARGTLSTFFRNYAELANGMDRFIAVQRGLLADEIRVEVEMFGETKNYLGIDGYRRSLDDWGVHFTSEGFNFHVPEQSTDDGAIRVTISGAIHVTRGAEKWTVPSDQNQWTETFYLDQEGKISRLIVSMNIPLR